MNTVKDIETEDKILSRAAQSKSVDVSKNDSSLQNQNTPTFLSSTVDIIETKKEMHQEISEKNRLEFRQIEEGEGDYDSTPKILTGMSAKIFGIYYTSDATSFIKSQVEVKDIPSAFAEGTYPSLDFINALSLEGPFSGYVWTVNGVPRLKLNWNLRIASKADWSAVKIS